MTSIPGYKLLPSQRATGKYFLTGQFGHTVGTTEWIRTLAKAHYYSFAIALTTTPN